MQITALLVIALWLGLPISHGYSNVMLRFENPNYSGTIPLNPGTDNLAAVLARFAGLDEALIFPGTFPHKQLLLRKLGELVHALPTRSESRALESCSMGLCSDEQVVFTMQTPNKAEVLVYRDSIEKILQASAQQIMAKLTLIASNAELLADASFRFSLHLNPSEEREDTSTLVAPLDLSVIDVTRTNSGQNAGGPRISLYHHGDENSDAIQRLIAAHVFGYNEASQEIVPTACKGCTNFHGQTYNGLTLPTAKAGGFFRFSFLKGNLT